jgi:toxin ParE1/3/4
MRGILKRQRAADDLIELWDYIAEDSVTRADAFIDDFNAKFQLLAEQPMLGRSREELAPGLRSLPFGRYLAEGHSLGIARRAAQGRMPLGEMAIFCLLF